MRKRMKFLIVLVAAFVGLFLYFHRNPVIAVRTVVFSSGYFDKGMNSKISKVNNDLYTISPPPIEKATFSELKTYKVKKKWGLYFAEYNGEV